MKDECCANCTYQSTATALSYCGLKQKPTEDDYVCNDYEPEKEQTHDR